MSVQGADPGDSLGSDGRGLNLVNLIRKRTPLEGVTTKNEGVMTENEGVMTENEGVTTKNEGVMTEKGHQIFGGRKRSPSGPQDNPGSATDCSVL